MIAFGCCEKAANGHCVCLELMEVIWGIRGEIYVCTNTAVCVQSVPREAGSRPRAHVGMKVLWMGFDTAVCGTFCSCRSVFSSFPLCV